MESATKSLKLCDFPLGLIAVKNNNIISNDISNDNLPIFSLLRTKMLAKKISKLGTNQNIILRPELTNLFLTEKMH